VISQEQAVLLTIILGMADLDEAIRDLHKDIDHLIDILSKV
jgi:hypothetical protein